MVFFAPRANRGGKAFATGDSQLLRSHSKHPPHTHTHKHTHSHRLAYSKQGAACQGYGVNAAEEGPAGGGADSSSAAAASAVSAAALVTTAAMAVTTLMLALVF